MATKSKTAKPKAAKTPRKRAAPKQNATRGIVVANHRFEPGTEVGFYPVSAVSVERTLDREPIPDPTATAKVGKDGVLTVSGLAAGMWVAAARVGARWRYFQFSA